MYNIAQFFISNENITNFKRDVKKPRDCVINALELIGILQSSYADIMRIAVGDYGLDTSQIEQIFYYVQSNFRWKFVRYTNIDTLVQFCLQTLQPSHVIFCGYSMIVNGTIFKHVFLIGKTNQLEIKYMDPQINAFCNLDEINCYNNIGGAQEYYILQTTADSHQIQQMQDL